MKILVDVDTGIDDALALFFLAFVQKKGLIEILGSSTVGGNVDVEQTTENTLKIWELLGLNIPVAKGSETPLNGKLSTAPFVHGDDGLGNTFLVNTKKLPSNESAVEMIIRLSKENDGKLNLITTAPLTNLAKSIKLDPCLVKRIKKLVIMGGGIYTGNVTAVAEANIANDPEAAKIVFSSGMDMTMVGLDVTHKVYFEEKDLCPLKNINSNRAKFILKIIRYISDAYEKITGWNRCVLHDPLAAGVCIYPDLIKSELLFTDVELKGDITRGMTVVDRRFRKPTGKENIKVAIEVDAERFKKILMESLLFWADE